MFNNGSERYIAADKGKSDGKYLNLIFDVYNKKWKTDGICGTLTTYGNTSFTQCGTFFVIRRIKKDARR